VDSPKRTVGEFSQDPPPLDWSGGDSGRRSTTAREKGHVHPETDSALSTANVG